MTAEGGVPGDRGPSGVLSRERLVAGAGGVPSRLRHCWHSRDKPQPELPEQGQGRGYRCLPDCFFPWCLSKAPALPQPSLPLLGTINLPCPV